MIVGLATRRRILKARAASSGLSLSGHLRLLANELDPRLSAVDAQRVRSSRTTSRPEEG